MDEALTSLSVGAKAKITMSAAYGYGTRLTCAYGVPVCAYGVPVCQLPCCVCVAVPASVLDALTS